MCNPFAASRARIDNALKCALFVGGGGDNRMVMFDVNVLTTSERGQFIGQTNFTNTGAATHSERTERT